MSVLPFGTFELAALVVERSREDLELAAHDRRLLGCDHGLGLGGDLRSVRGKAGEPVLDAAVVEGGLPRPVHRCLDAAQVVRAPVVDRRRQPGRPGELARVRVVADPRDAFRLRVLAGGRAVDVLADHVGAPGADEALCCLLLLGRVVPRVRPDELHLHLLVDRLRAERERVRMTDHLGNREGDDVADLAVLRRSACGHAGEIDRVLTGAEVLGHVLGQIRSRRLLEEHVRILGRELLAEEAERRAEDDLVAVADEARNRLLELRAVRDVLLERRLHLGAELLLDIQPPHVVRLRPAGVVVRPDVDPGGLHRPGVGLGGGSARHDESRDGEGAEQGDDRDPPSAQTSGESRARHDFSFRAGPVLGTGHIGSYDLASADRPGRGRAMRPPGEATLSPPRQTVEPRTMVRR